jgi:hypothetical protein
MANGEVLDYILKGNIMSQPEKCPDQIYAIMKECWVLNPSKRPQFADICKDINNLYHKNMPKNVNMNDNSAPSDDNEQFYN